MPGELNYFKITLDSYGPLCVYLGMRKGKIIMA